MNTDSEDNSNSNAVLILQNGGVDRHASPTALALGFSPIFHCTFNFYASFNTRSMYVFTKCTSVNFVIELLWPSNG